MGPVKERTDTSTVVLAGLRREGIAGLTRNSKFEREETTVKHQTIRAVLALSGLRRACIEVRLSRLAEKTPAQRQALRQQVRYGSSFQIDQDRCRADLCQSYAALTRRSSTSPAILLWRESTKERLFILANLG